MTVQVLEALGAKVAGLHAIELIVVVAANADGASGACDGNWIGRRRGSHDCYRATDRALAARESYGYRRDDSIGNRIGVQPHATQV